VIEATAIGVSSSTIVPTSSGVTLLANCRFGRRATPVVTGSLIPSVNAPSGTRGR
jgi:hypothetical protein